MHSPQSTLVQLYCAQAFMSCIIFLTCWTVSVFPCCTWMGSFHFGGVLVLWFVAVQAGIKMNETWYWNMKMSLIFFKIVKAFGNERNVPVLNTLTRVSGDQQYMCTIQLCIFVYFILILSLSFLSYFCPILQPFIYLKPHIMTMHSCRFPTSNQNLV